MHIHKKKRNKGDKNKLGRSAVEIVRLNDTWYLAANYYAMAFLYLTKLATSYIRLNYTQKVQIPRNTDCFCHMGSTF